METLEDSKADIPLKSEFSFVDVNAIKQEPNTDDEQEVTEGWLTVDVKKECIDTNDIKEEPSQISTCKIEVTCSNAFMSEDNMDCTECVYNTTQASESDASNEHFDKDDQDLTYTPHFNTSGTNETSEKAPKPLVSKQNSVKRKPSMHNCLYCDIPVLNFARHLARRHSDKESVQQFLALNKTDPERKQLIHKLRKGGSFCTGKVIPMQKKQEPWLREDDNSCTYLPCIHCKGFYAKTALRRHVNRCAFNKTITGSERKCQSDSYIFEPNDPLYASGVLRSLKADEVSLIAKKDKIICEVARRHVKSCKEKYLVLAAKRYMRRLGRLLSEIRKIENNKALTLLSILHPSKFKTIVHATKSLSQYDCDTKSFNYPSLALQMGTLLRKAVSAAYSLEVQANVDSPRLNALLAMKRILENEWSTEVPTEVGEDVNINNRFDKPTIIPMAEDLAKMKTYFENLISNSKLKLQSNPSDETAYKCLIEGTYCSLLLFNKRRVGELQRILLDAYVKHHSQESLEYFEHLLTPIEKVLTARLKRIAIRAKCGREVPVLFNKVTQEGIDVAINYRNNFYETDNPYLFGACHSENYINGYQVFRNHVILALGDPNKTSSLTSTKLRTHLATISQILQMGNEKIEQLATFMGHTMETHSEWYRLPLDMHQIAKVSKILLLSQNDCIDRYGGCNLNELELGNELIETQSESDVESEMEDMLEQGDILTSEVSQTGTQIIRKRKIVRTAWSQEEKNVTENYFKDHIKKRIVPRKEEVITLTKRYKELFKNRNWTTIKAYIFNKYNK